jgi:hypothetical protein
VAQPRRRAFEGEHRGGRRQVVEQLERDAVAIDPRIERDVRARQETRELIEVGRHQVDGFADTQIARQRLVPPERGPATMVSRTSRRRSRIFRNAASMKSIP